MTTPTMDVSSICLRYGYSREVISVIEKENLLPLGLLKRLHSKMNHIRLFKDENGQVDIDKSAQNWIDFRGAGHFRL